jgi:hypothetical protein
VLRPGGVLVFSVPNMKHGERKFEQWIGQLAAQPWIHRLARSITTVRNYLDYLRLSRNRFSPGVWEQRAAVHRFSSYRTDADTLVKRPLLLISLRKMP